MEEGQRHTEEYFKGKKSGRSKILCIHVRKRRNGDLKEKYTGSNSYKQHIGRLFKVPVSTVYITWRLHERKT
jgi:hypothetical protein